MKKSPKKIDQKISFTSRLLIGFIISFSLVLTAFEWTTITTNARVFPELETIDEDETILVPIVYRTEKLEKPKPKNPDVAPEPTPDPIPEPTPDPTPDPAPDPIDPDLTHVDSSLFGSETFDENDIFITVEIFAHYDECAGLRGDELMECSKISIANKIKKNFRITGPMKDIGGKQGALMNFVVDKDGNIHSITAKQKTNKHVAKAAQKAIEGLPQLNPARQQGQTVSLMMEIPIIVDIKD